MSARFPSFRHPAPSPHPLRAFLSLDRFLPMLHLLLLVFLAIGTGAPPVSAFRRVGVKKPAPAQQPLPANDLSAAADTSTGRYQLSDDGSHDTVISVELFRDLEELSRVVDISYCVGVTGIRKPFECASRCADFKGWELVTTWNTGMLMSDSSGYMVISHPPSPPRIILAFRGTYSIANTITDLSTVPQEYIPYPGDEDDDEGEEREGLKKRDIDPDKAECTDCTVHAGFMKAWRETRPYVIPHVKELVQKYPGYRVTLVGHSLGGAIAALASLDFQSRGWNPQVTTFGEPRIGNAGLVKYIDASFAKDGLTGNITASFRRVTHASDPIPLLPLTEWGYRMHAGEIFISKKDLSPEVQDLWYCDGDEDARCIAGAESSDRPSGLRLDDEWTAIEQLRKGMVETKGIFEIPLRWRVWELFFAHRDYFWRLGMCIPGGDPKDWYREYPEDEVDEL